MTEASQIAELVQPPPQLPEGSSLLPDPVEMFPWLKCTVFVELPVTRTTVRELLALAPGSILETSCKATSDLPVRVNGVLIGWAEFDVVSNHLAVRITELA